MDKPTRREAIEMAAGVVVAVGVTGAAVAAPVPDGEPGRTDHEGRMTIEELREALIERMNEAAEVAWLELQRMRDLTGQEPSRTWISEMAIDCGIRALADVDLGKVQQHLDQSSEQLPARELTCGVNRELDYVWVRPSETIERGANGAPMNMVKLPRAARFSRPLFEG